MAGPSEGGGMLEVVGARRRDVLTAGDVAEAERAALRELVRLCFPVPSSPVQLHPEYQPDSFLRPVSYSDVRRRHRRLFRQSP